MSEVLVEYWGSFSDPFYYDFFNMFSLIIFIVVIFKLLVLVVASFFS